MCCKNYTFLILVMGQMLKLLSFYGGSVNLINLFEAKFSCTTTVKVSLTKMADSHDMLNFSSGF